MLHTVLIVDDCADAALGFARLLRAWGHQTRIATDGPEALRLTRGDPPDVVLLDVCLPGMDGFEVARRLRVGAGGKDVLIVIVSGYASEEDHLRAEEAGCDVYLVKPVDLEELRAVLARETFTEEVRATRALKGHALSRADASGPPRHAACS